MIGILTIYQDHSLHQEPIEDVGQSTDGFLGMADVQKTHDIRPRCTLFEEPSGDNHFHTTILLSSLFGR